MTFNNLISDKNLLKAIQELGHTSPTPIQEKAIPSIMEGADLLATAQTGTGKTGAFLLPALSRLAKPSAHHGRGPRILVLVPTRELAIQVATEAVKYSKHLPHVKTVCIYGGAPYPVQNRQLAKPHDILIATHGRLIDHLESGRANLSRVELLILDEADRMLDIGFIQPVEEIAGATPENRQTLLFSATLKKSVLRLAAKLLKNPLEIKVSPDNTAHKNITQRLQLVDNIGHKERLLDHLLHEKEVTQAIVFTATKRQADQLVDKLIDSGLRAAALHGDMNQRQRTRTISRLRQGEVRILVATDVAARGIDIPAISHVVNFDLPFNTEDYVHRIGRTGRAGATGISISYAAPRDLSLVRDIEKLTGQKMEAVTTPGLEPRERPKPYAAKKQFSPKTHKNTYNPRFRRKEHRR